MKRLLALGSWLLAPGLRLRLLALGSWLLAPGLRLLVAALILLLAGCEKKDAGQEAGKIAPDENTLVKESKKGPVTLRVIVSPAKPRLSDLVQLALEVRSGPDVEIKPPPFGKSLGEFQIRDYRDVPARIEEGQTVRRFEYQLEPLEAGKHLIRSIDIAFTNRQAGSEGEGKASTLEAEPIEIEVLSESGAGEPDLAQLAPMAEPVALPPGPLPAWVWGCMGGAVLAIALLAGWLLRKKKLEAARAVVRTPEEIALAELEALMSAQLPEQGLFSEFYVRLTGTVRRYVERTTGLHAPEQTTEEFLRALRGDTRFDPQQARRLGHFLEASDLVKYAGQRPEAREIQDAFRRAQEFVGLTDGGKLLISSPKTGATGLAVETSV